MWISLGSFILPCPLATWCTDASLLATTLAYYTTAVMSWCTNAVMHWCADALMHWCTDAVIHWWTDALVQWYTDTLMQWSWCTDAMYLSHYYALRDGFQSRHQCTSITMHQCISISASVHHCISVSVLSISLIWLSTNMNGFWSKLLREARGSTVISSSL